MKATLIMLLVALVFLGEYSLGEMMTEPYLRYDGTGKDGTPLALYNPVTDAPIYVAMGRIIDRDNRSNDGGKFAFEFQGVTYEIIPMKLGKIQVYRRD